MIHITNSCQDPNTATTNTSDRFYTRQEGFGLPLHYSLFPKGSTAVQLSSHSAAEGKQANRFGLKFTENYRYYLETLNQYYYYYYDKEVRVKLLQVTNRPRQAGGISKRQVCSAECCRNHQTQLPAARGPHCFQGSTQKMQLLSGQPPGSACPSLIESTMSHQVICITSNRNLRPSDSSILIPS